MKTAARIKESLGDNRTLPALATVVTRLMALEKEGAGTREVARAIGDDPALSARVLRVANSSLYAVAGNVSTVQKAVTLLGSEVVIHLALALSVLDIFPLNKSRQFNYPRFWSFCLSVAVLSKLMATRQKDCDPEECFTAGLLHNMGVLFLFKTVPTDYLAVFDDTRREGGSLNEIEQRLLGIDHCEVGAILADAWGLPPVIRAASRCHHGDGVDDLDEHLQPVCRTVQRVLPIAHVLQNDHWENLDEVTRRDLFRHWSMEIEQIDDVFARTMDEVREASSAYGLNSVNLIVIKDDYVPLML